MPAFKKAQFTISVREHVESSVFVPKTVQGYTDAKGLVGIHQAYGCWLITHIKSGLCIQRGFRTKRAAVIGANKLFAGVSQETLAGDKEALVSALTAGLRVAIRETCY